MIEEFGRTGAGEAVHRVALSGHGFSAGVLTLGAILQDFRLGARALTLGSPKLAAYDAGPMQFFGAVIGPVAGRVAGAAGEIDGVPVRMEANEGPNALHSGSAGLHAKVWEIEAHDATSVTLVRDAVPGEGGLPGTRRFSARYTLEPTGLRLTLGAETDAATWVNLTQHSYWHLGGDPGIDGHSLRLMSETYLPIDDATLPVGEIASVDDSRFDFRQGRVLAAEDQLDHCFVLAPGAPGAALTAPDGLTMTLTTDAPGVQIHTGDGVGAPADLCWDGAAMSSRPGLALEAQDWPDAPRWSAFPSIRLEPGVAWRREILFAVAQGGSLG